MIEPILQLGTVGTLEYSTTVLHGVMKVEMWGRPGRHIVEEKFILCYMYYLSNYIYIDYR